LVIPTGIVHVPAMYLISSLVTNIPFYFYILEYSICIGFSLQT
jgi:hypothetical protein